MAAKRLLILRVTLTAPTAGVIFSLQDKDGSPVEAVTSDGSDLTFDIPIDVADGETGPRYLGPHVRANSGEKFVYIASGGQAGQTGTEWTRRIKIMLMSLPPELAARGGVLAVVIPGTMKDGGPICGSIRPTGWTQVGRGSGSHWLPA